MKAQLENVVSELRDGKGGVEVVLCDGDQLEGRAMAGNEAGYDTEEKKILINTRKTDTSRGAALMASAGHETQRIENAENKWLQGMSRERQDHLARSRGDNAERVHERFNGIQRSNRQARDDFHTRNAASLARSTKVAARSKDKNVKPREYNWDRKTQKLTKISEKGGDYLHYVHHGSTDENGNFVPEEITYHNRKGAALNAAGKEQLEEKLRQEGVSLLGVVGESAGQVDSAANGMERGFKRKGGGWGKTKNGIKHYKKFRGNQHVSVKSGDEIAKQVKKNFKKVKKASDVYKGLRAGQALYRDYQEGDVFGIRSRRAITEYAGGWLGTFGGGWLGSFGGPVSALIGASAGSEIVTDIAGDLTQQHYEIGERSRLTNDLIHSDIARELSPIVAE